MKNEVKEIIIILSLWTFITTMAMFVNWNVRLSTLTPSARFFMAVLYLISIPIGIAIISENDDDEYDY